MGDRPERGLPNHVRQHLYESVVLKEYKDSLFHANSFRNWARKRVRKGISKDIPFNEKHINASGTRINLVDHLAYSKAAPSKEGGKSTWLQRARLWYWIVPELEQPTRRQRIYDALHPKAFCFDNPMRVIKTELAATKYRSLARRIISKGDFPPSLLEMDPSFIQK
jgi:hypothetical protein